MEERKQIHLNDVFCDGVDCICVLGNEHSGSIKDGLFFEHLNYFQFLKKSFVQCKQNLKTRGVPFIVSPSKPVVTECPGECRAFI